LITSTSTTQQSCFFFQRIQGATYKKEELSKQIQDINGKLEATAHLGVFSNLFGEAHTPVIVVEDFEKLECRVRDNFRAIIASGKINRTPLSR
jgi:hypothetical protein